MSQTQSNSKYVWTSVIVGNLMTFTAGLLSTWQIMGIGEIGPINDRNYLWYMRTVYPLGGLFGSLLSGFRAHVFGRKHTLLLLGTLYLLAILHIAVFAGWNKDGILAAQFFGGFATGGILVVLPVYIVEIAESRNRGRLGSLMNVFYCIGYLFMPLLLAILAGAIIPTCVMCLILVAIFLLAIFAGIYETPQYLILQKEEQEAKESLQKLRSSLQVDNEYLEIRDVTLSQSASKGVLHALALFTFRGLAGTQVAITYGIWIQSREETVTEGYYQLNTFMFFVPLISSIFSIYLMDVIGRKIILAISTVGTFIAQIIIGIYIKDRLHKTYWFITLTIAILKICYSVGLATLPFLVAAELQTSKRKTLVLGATASINWFINFILTGYYFSIARCVGETTMYWFFPLINATAVLYYIVRLPETMKKSAKEIRDTL